MVCPHAKRKAVDDYSADMSEKPQESHGTVGNDGAIKTVVQQYLTGIRRTF
jgi:hypothetical protein